jgi:hypothetical protein
VPRRRATSLAISLGAGALLAVCLAVDAGAQLADPASVLRPEVDGDPRNAQGFRRFDGARARTPFAITNNPPPSRRPDQTPVGQKPKFEVPKYGNPPASGAGKTGFNSGAPLRRLGDARGLRLSTQRVTLPSAPLDRLGTAVTSPIMRPSLPRPAALTPDRTDAERAAALFATRHQPSIDQNPRLRPRVEIEPTSRSACAPAPSCCGRPSTSPAATTPIRHAATMPSDRRW